MKNYYSERIICLTEETTETLYLLGEQERIIGISGFTVRPKIAKKEKKVVSTFKDAKIKEILALKPDLVIGFSDIQADIAQELIKNGITVWLNNYRSVEGIFKMMVQLGMMVGKGVEALELVSQYQNRIDKIKRTISQWKLKPKVYFEEWDNPMISGIQWVSELIEMAGGIDINKSLAKESLAKGRIIEDPSIIVAANPDIILASWCGKMYKPKRMFARKGWKEIAAYQSKQYFEIDSSIILQPGPAALTDGLEKIHSIFTQWQREYD